jgi:hypothetical protein
MSLGRALALHRGRDAVDQAQAPVEAAAVVIGELIDMVKAESAGESWPFVLWMITRTYWFGCRFAPFRRPGEITSS